MLRSIHLLLVLVGLAALCPGVSPRASMATQAAPQATGPVGVSAGLIPLPKSCGGTLPPGSGVPACCMFGYVFIDGQAVEGARLTFTSAHGKLEAWTERGADSANAYYRVSLSDAPLALQAGDTLTITADYSAHTFTITHAVLSGGQQVDVVLPRNQPEDYTFERQIMPLASPGQLRYLSGIAVDGAGTVYVINRAEGQIQVFNSSGQFLLMWGRRGSRRGQLLEPNGITVDRQGHVYVADSDNQRIQKFTSTGTWLASWDRRGAGDGQFLNPIGVSVDRDGNVYISDTIANRIQKFSGDGTWLASWGSQGSGNGQFISPQGLSVANDGSIYVLDRGNNRIQKFSGDGTWLASWGSQGSGNGQFELAMGISVDQAGNVYVADSYNHRIQKFSGDGTWLASWGSFGRANGQFTELSGVALDSAGNIYVADSIRIQKLRSDGTWLASWGDQKSDGPRFSYPFGIAIAADSTVYVSDRHNNRIQKFSSDGTWGGAWGGAGNAPGQFAGPAGLAIDRDGAIYVADTYNHRIQKLSGDGTWLASWGSQGSGNGQFSNPIGVAVDRQGNVYVAEYQGHRVQKFSGDGTWLASWGSQGSGNGQFSFPMAVAVNSHGDVYVADGDNHRLQKFSSDGTWLASWGQWGSANGLFYTPAALAIDSSDNIYVVDSESSRTQKFTSDGVWLSSWGTWGIADGLFEEPRGIALDNSGRIYITDSSSNRLQVVYQQRHTRPIATIVVAAPRSVIQGQPVELVGMGSDSDVSPQIAAYEWTLDESATPFVSTPTAMLPTSGLAVGRHMLTLRVRDTEGEVSDPQTIQIDVAPVAPPPLETWTMLLYLDADTPPGSLAPYLDRSAPLGALFRLEHVISNPHVPVVALYDGPGAHDSFRYILRPDGSIVQEMLDEVNMGDPQTMVDFVRWGQQQAPADHYYLALADHANSLDGIAWDATSSPTEHLTNAELRQALLAITDNGAHPIDVLHLDACLMGMIENAYQLRGLARYMVASENLAWSAFAYERYRAAIGVQTSPAELAIAVADQYAARVGEGQDAAARLPYTIAAMDLGRLDDLVQATDVLAQEAQRFALASHENRILLAGLRRQAQAFDSDANNALTPADDHIDLAHWAELVQANVHDSAVQDAAEALRAALAGFVLRERHSTGSYQGLAVNLDHARGVGVYYPSAPSARTYQTYRQGGLTFIDDTRWDEFLAAVLAEQPFNTKPSITVPAAPVPFVTASRKVYLPLIQR